MRYSVYTPFLRRFTDEHARDLSDTITLYNQVTAAHRATRYGQADAVENFAHVIATVIREELSVPESEVLLEALDRCLKAIVGLEAVMFDSPDVNFSQPISLKEQVDLRRFLRAQEYFISRHEKIADRFVGTIGGIFGGIIRAIPALQEGSFTVPLINIVKNPHDLVDAIIGTICDDELEETGLFIDLQARLHINVLRASGIPIGEKSRKPIITAAKSGLLPEELVSTYLADTPFHDLLLAPASIEIPQEQQFSGHWIIAPPGRGKTTLLHAMLLHDFQRDASIIIMDSKGDLLDPIKKLRDISNRFVLIEPDAEFPLALNPLDVPKTNVTHTISLLEYVFNSLLEAKATALQTTLFRRVLPALVNVIPNATLATFRDLMVNGFDAYREYIDQLDANSRNFFYTQFNTKTYEGTREQLVWRIDFLMTNPFIKSMFGAFKTRLDIGNEMDAGKIILINNSTAMLGEEGSEFFGRFFIALVLAAAQQRAGRPQHQKKPVFFYIDECQTVISRDPKIATILDQCRSQRIALILAHQRLTQIKDKDVSSALANCAIRFANSDDEAKELSDKLRTTPEFLRNLRVGQFAAFIRDFTKTGLALDVPYYDLSRLPQLSYQEQDQIRDRMRAQFSAPPQLEPPQSVYVQPAPEPPKIEKRPQQPPEPPKPTAPPPKAKRKW